jgi:hypothetical protein
MNGRTTNRLAAAPDATGQTAPDVIDGHVTAGSERALAVEHWLLCAADDRDLARKQWAQPAGIALLACGGVLSAVRLPARLVWAAVGADELPEVDERLRQWFDGGSLFVDLHSHMYYALVPGGTQWQFTDRQLAGVDFLGRDNYLGVPAVHLTEPGSRSYWCVPMDTAGDLCFTDEVVQLAQRGQAALTEGAGR